MKLAIWFCFLAVLMASFTACLWVYPMPDALFESYNGKPMPNGTAWAQEARAWIPACSLPWLVGAIWLSAKQKVELESFAIFAASSLLACMLLLLLAMALGILPFHGNMIYMPRR